MLIQEKGTPDPDFTYNGTTLTYWTIIEVNTAVVVGCIMTLKPLVSKVFPGLLASRSASSETSMVSSDPPLTIGSKPSRNPLSPARRDSWMELPGHNDMGDAMLRDIESGKWEKAYDLQQPPPTHFALGKQEDDMITVVTNPDKDNQFRQSDSSSG